MSFVFKKAIRENVYLLVGFAGGPGSGKTMSAAIMAQGISQGKPWAIIDTEGGRALHYAKRPGEPDTFGKFDFFHGDMKPPFSPEKYIEAIRAAETAGYGVIVVDSCSHEWEGDGGVLEMQEEEFVRLGERESCRFKSWNKPKTEHKHFINALLQVRAHIILCFRAQEKIEMVKNEKGFMEPQQKKGLIGKDGWFPICEKNLPFEMTAYFLLLASNPGVTYPIKLQEQHKAIFPPGKQIDESCGQRLLAWASSPGIQPAAPAQNAVPKPSPDGPVNVEKFRAEVAKLDFDDGDILAMAQQGFPNIKSVSDLTSGQAREVYRLLKKERDFMNQSSDKGEKT